MMLDVVDLQAIGLLLRGNHDTLFGLTGSRQNHNPVTDAGAFAAFPFCNIPPVELCATLHGTYGECVSAILQLYHGLR